MLAHDGAQRLTPAAIANGTPTPSLTGDAITDALIPTAMDFIVAVHDEKYEDLAAIRAEAERIVSRLSGKAIADGTVELHAAWGIAMICGSWDDVTTKPTAALAWLRNRDEYKLLRQAGMDAVTAAELAAKHAMKGGAA